MRAIYLFLLASVVGIEFSVGAFVAPVLFYPEQFLGSGVLTHFQSGILMSQIFIKYNYVLLFVSVFSIIFETINLKNKQSFYAKISKFMLSFIVIGLSLSFVFYFTPYILQAQNIGEVATNSVEFANIHKASEYVMKLMIMAQILLFFMQFSKTSNNS